MMPSVVSNQDLKLIAQDREDQKKIKELMLLNEDIEN
jgi:hypothetical protein